MQEVADKMSANQLADAQRRVREWMEPGLPCPATELPTHGLTSPDDWRKQAITLIEQFGRSGSMSVMAIYRQLTKAFLGMN